MRSSRAVRMIDREAQSAHRALVARVLRIDDTAWEMILDAFHAQTSSAAPLDDRMAFLSRLVAESFPDAPAVRGALAGTPCPACHGARVRERYRRMADKEHGGAPLYAYGVCEGCGHALLLAGAADSAVYASPAYYQTQGSDGVGYSAYEGEREYREAKADRLLQWAMAATQLAPTTLLEVGSGFGFTRRAAERLGLHTAGVDLNPAAAAAARRLYEMETFVGTLADAMSTGELAEETMDLVLYDFVLEHLADPVQELARAARMLSPQGVLVVRVPGIEALELVPFGSLYRSFRRDHLHLFSRDSISRMLHAAGLTLTVFDTACGADLLREVLTPSELRSVYAAGRGPDITICATRMSRALPTRHHS